ncbi:TAXI family TRAP transporter solute-binding subunit [Rhizobacter sp. Root1221]|uniref:TAXI family TRAP transporter solute-binding subunit n=1 Tax=Rhizobacter sp. Root1221 TaxID=1736433 RepID=UPI0006F30C2A|nr:TAXI family TRAP transporter solute-binding subunit [Rhizobacter sp. Root1221]KQW01634.1 C4-dicarboxylate ABC transporter substrate-binding protein [Rhizobacter sp. Root1221]
MPQALRNTLLSFRDLLATAGPFVLIAAVLLGVAYWVLDPTPPKRVVLATGVEQGAYAEFGRRYAAFLKGHGITVELRNTQGAAENLQLLRDENSGVDIAFVQGGADAERPGEPVEDEEDLMSLGSLFYEPVWLFYREDSAQRLVKAPLVNSLSQLQGWKINIGAPGSGVPNLMARLFEANRIDPSTLTLLRKPQTPAVVDFLEGEIDAIVFASAPESVMVQMLLQTPGIKLFDVAQADAYSRRFPFLSAVTLPRGVVDLAGDVPPADVRLIAPTATLVAREGTHPALIQLFMQAAQSVHGGAGWFQHKGDFPTARGAERKLAAEAQRFYRAGPPFLQRYLPFWLANLIDRMWVVLVSIVAILIPLGRVVPPLYQFRIRSRVFRWYGQLRALENAAGQRPVEELSRELDDIEARVENVSIPLSYADELYSLRSHIDMVRRKLNGVTGEA